MNRSRPIAVIHPDHLLERARSAPVGCAALTPDEWQKLGAHLAVCSACAWEQAATDDFARERASAAGPGDLNAAQLDSLIGGALARAGLEEPRVQALPPSPRITALRPTRSAGRRLAAAAMLAAAVGALLALPARAAHEAPREGPPLVAASEASLDAGALGSPSGGDS